MVNTRRSELEIIEEILLISKDGAKTTQLLYKCNLGYSQFKGYVSFLLEKNILEGKKIKNGKGYNTVYSTTDKGDDLLLHIKKTFSYLE